MISKDNIDGYAPAGHENEIKEYLKHDCLSLCEIMTRFRQTLLQDEKVQLDICDCFTSATLAKKLYFSKYYKDVVYTKIWKSGQPENATRYIYQVNKTIDAYLRESY